MNVLADAASIASESSENSDLVPPKKNVLKKKMPKLQHILMKLLNEESATDAIWWLPGEKEFAINAERFPAVLDRHLPGTKYASFIRRLHKLGFSRQTRSLKKVYGTLPEHAVAFHHEKFRKDKPELMDQLKNGYWKEAKARKAKGASTSTATASTEEASPVASPPAVVSIPPTAVPSISLVPPPETFSVSTDVKKPVAAAVAAAAQQQANVELLHYAEALRQQREVEANERNIQLILLRQRVAQEQQEMEQLLALRQQQEQARFLALLQQQQEEETMMAAYAAQAAAQAQAAPEAQSDLLLRLQLLQNLQQQQQQQAPFNPYNNGFLY